MQITRETDYAVRCVLHLSMAPERVAVISEIAKERNVPRSFLAKILQKLTRAGIVHSHRGLRGGFRLAGDPADVSLFEVVEAMQGPVVFNRCVAEKGFCSLSGDCAVHPVWADLSRSFTDRLKSITFDKLAREQKRNEKGVKEGADV